ncbi:Bifunctional protein GlmU [subsurface metagenome]
MKAVILAAGEGRRMHPLTYTRSKVMLPIANKPILEHLLIESRRAGIREFVLIVGYHDEQVRDYFGNGDKWGVSIAYCAQRKQLGTADALKMAEGLVNGNFLLINGDIIVSHKDISQLASKNDNTLSVIEVKDTRDLGMVELNEDRVTNIYEKTATPFSLMANACYI